MRGSGFLLALFLVGALQARGQDEWYTRAEAGPLFSMSYSVRNGNLVSETVTRQQFGFSGGKRLGNSYFSVESGLYRQSHGTVARLFTTEAAGGNNEAVTTQYTVYKIPVRITADMLDRQNKIGLQFMAGMSYLFNPGRKSLGEEVPGIQQEIVAADGRQVNVNTQFFNAGGWALETGIRASYALSKSWAAELTGGFQAGLRNMATTTVTYDNSPAGNSRKQTYSRADATTLLLSVRYTFGAD